MDALQVQHASYADKRPATTTSPVDVNVAENQVTVKMAKLPVRIVGDDSGSTAVVVKEVRMGHPLRSLKQPTSYREPSQRNKLHIGNVLFPKMGRVNKINGKYERTGHCLRRHFRTYSGYVAASDKLTMMFKL